MQQEPHIELLDPRMVEILREKTPAECLAIAHGMWTHARDTITGVLEFEHPDWTQEAVQREVARRLLNGSV